LGQCDLLSKIIPENEKKKKNPQNLLKKKNQQTKNHTKISQDGKLYVQV